MTIRTSLSALLLSAVGAGSVAAADCPACRDVKAPQDYLACMKACLAENSAQTTSVTTTSPLDKFAKDAESAGWTLSKNHDTVTDVTTVSVSKTSIEALKVSNQPMEVTLTFSADSKAVGGLYLRVPDLSNLKSIPFLSLFDSMAVSALFGNTVTARVDKNEATTLKVRSTKDGIYLEGSEKLLPQMTTGGTPHRPTLRKLHGQNGSLFRSSGLQVRGAVGTTFRGRHQGRARSRRSQRIAFRPRETLRKFSRAPPRRRSESTLCHASYA